MKTIDLIQGSPEWQAHRAQHFNASDAPAMMGCSPYMTRTELLTRMKTGISAEVDAATQRRFDDGHRFEALARPLAEKIIGEELYPVTGTNGQLSASFDGLTMLGDTAFEHKTLNLSMAGLVWVSESAADFLPLHYLVQMEQQLMVSGADRVLFMATKWNGDTLVEARHCWYVSDPELAAKITAGWKQFAADLAVFQPSAAQVEKVVAESVEALPAPVVTVTGELALQDNFKVFETRLRDFLANRLIREPKTDEDFVNLDAQIRAMKQGREALKASKAQMLAQVQPIDQASKTADMLDTLLQQNVSMAEKLLTAEKDRRKGEIVAGGVKAFADHISALNARLGKPYMPNVPTDFGAVIRGLKSLASMEDKVAGELARAKIAANEVADKIDTNLKHLRETAGQHTFLFADAASIVLKAPDDLQALVANRIGEHERAEEARREKERERIRAEEQARADREVRERQAAADAQAQREAQAAIAAAATPAPAPAPVAAPAPAPVAARVSPAVPTDSGARLTLGQINERLEVVSVNAEQLARLGFPATVNRSARTYLESDFPRMCAVIQRHLIAAAQGVEA